MPSDAPDLTPARLEKLLATVSLPLDNRGQTSREKSEAIETLIALYATLSSRVIELEGEVERLRGALDAVAGCSGYMRAGGATVGDLDFYEEGLERAIAIAVEALGASNAE